MRLLSDRLSELHFVLVSTIEKYGFAEVTPAWINMSFEGRLHHQEMYFPMGSTWPKPGNPQKDFREWMPIQGLRLVDDPSQEDYIIKRALSANPSPPPCLSRHEEKNAQVTLLKHPVGI